MGWWRFGEAGSSCPSHASVPPVSQADHTTGSGEEHTVSATKKLMCCLDMHLKTNRKQTKVLTHKGLPGMMSGEAQLCRG